MKYGPTLPETHFVLASTLAIYIHVVEVPGSKDIYHYVGEAGQFESTEQIHLM